MRILIEPDFRKEYENIKEHLMPFELVELEKILKDIQDKPENVEELGKTGFYKRVIEIEYNIYILICEYNKKSKLLIYWNIE